MNQLTESRIALRQGRHADAFNQLADIVAAQEIRLAALEAAAASPGAAAKAPKPPKAPKTSPKPATDPRKL